MGNPTPRRPLMEEDIGTMPAWPTNWAPSETRWNKGTSAPSDQRAVYVAHENATFSLDAVNTSTLKKLLLMLGGTLIRRQFV